ncbi:hypothetical protein C8J57DRAFT_1231366 [Mycena rebaudengoi]|nr:hypothetical protein C8J57DRAFT_1231366 [Mycena rebaudengoi]
MPRAAEIATPLALRKDLTIGKTPPFPPLRCQCAESGCPWSYNRASDLKPHMERHMSLAEKERLMFRCPVPGCAHKTLQKSNMATHYRTHTSEKPCICLDYAADGAPCVFRCGDPGSLTRHQATMHGAVGKGKHTRYTPYKCRRASSSISASDFGSSSASSDSNYLDTSGGYTSSSSSSSGYSSASPAPLSTSFSGQDAGITTQDPDFEATFAGVLNGSICVPVIPTIPTTARPGPAMQHPAQDVQFFGYMIEQQQNFTLAQRPLDFNDPYLAQQLIFEYDASQKGNVFFGAPPSLQFSYCAESYPDSSCDFSSSPLDFAAAQYPSGEFEFGLGLNFGCSSPFDLLPAGFEHEWFTCKFTGN